MSKRALILGIGGQDGSYLAEHLLSLDYEVHGLHRRSSVDNLWRIADVRDRVTLHKGDLLDPLSVGRVLDDVCPDELYNEADQDNVDHSFKTAGYSAAVTAGAVADLLEMLRVHSCQGLRFFQPLSATMFGCPASSPQDEKAPLQPNSPYACAKAAAWHLCRHYRREHGLHVVCGILYNHDSPRRGPDYVLQRIARQAVAQVRGGGGPILLGNPDLSVDVGHAADYVRGIHALMQLERPDDFVLATDRPVTLRQLAEHALCHLGKEDYLLSDVGRDPSFHRPGPLPILVGDSTKARRVIDWQPRSSLKTLEDILDHLTGERRGT